MKRHWTGKERADGREEHVRRWLSSMAATVTALLMVTAAGGCAGLVRRAAQPTMDSVIEATMKQSDPELVRLGAPSYMLMIDGLVARSPRDIHLLTAAARLYSAYASAFVSGEEPERARSMTRKARDYAFQAMSIENEKFKKLHDKPYEDFAPVPAAIEKGSEELLFAVVSTWAAYIQAHRDDWDALADLPKVEALARRLLELDETHYYGSAHLVLGVLQTVLPPAMGGQPESAKEHFEKAIAISQGRFLQAHVLYAERYARLVFDRGLHDRLLQHVLETPADVAPELTLVNTLAKRRAQELLARADGYF